MTVALLGSATFDVDREGAAEERGRRAAGMEILPLDEELHCNHSSTLDVHKREATGFAFAQRAMGIFFFDGRQEAITR
jgi:hypothetical protein